MPQDRRGFGGHSLVGQVAGDDFAPEAGVKVAASSVQSQRCPGSEPARRCAESLGAAEIKQRLFGERSEVKNWEGEVEGQGLVPCLNMLGLFPSLPSSALASVKKVSAPK